MVIAPSFAKIVDILNMIDLTLEYVMIDGVEIPVDKELTVIDVLNTDSFNRWTKAEIIKAIDTLKTYILGFQESHETASRGLLEEIGKLTNRGDWYPDNQYIISDAAIVGHCVHNDDLKFAVYAPQRMKRLASRNVFLEGMMRDMIKRGRNG